MTTDTDHPSREQVNAGIDSLPCECALLSVGDGPVDHCVRPAGHGGLHETPRGVRWADPRDGEEECDGDDGYSGEED
jgi:hypothetical protein